MPRYGLRGQLFELNQANFSEFALEEICLVRLIFESDVDDSDAFAALNDLNMTLRHSRLQMHQE